MFSLSGHCELLVLSLLGPDVMVMSSACAMT